MTQSCPKCGSTMVTGYVIDQGYGRNDVARWIEGEPRKSFWGGLRLRGKTKVDIVTWRCRRCGFLENYAPSA